MTHVVASLGRKPALTKVLIVVAGVSLFLNAYTVNGLQEANAQFPSLFPPPPSSAAENSNDQNLRIATDDRVPPQIEFVTKELKQGKNVLIVKITDASDLKSRQVKYVNDGKIYLTDLVRDHDNVYVALVNVDPPSSIIEMDLIDAAGNRAIVAKEITVVPQSGTVIFIEQLGELWHSLLRFLGLK